MKTRALPPIALALVTILAPPAARAGHRHHGFSTRSRSMPARCEDISMEVGDRDAVRGEERLVYAVEAQPLKVVVPTNSGANVRGADRSDFEILVCKGAETAEGLAAITVSHANGTLSVKGPSGEDWVGFLLISAPRNASLDISTVNGPIGLSDLSGHVVARAENGPISVRDSAGDMDLSAENGPIDVRGGGGRMKVSTENGPIGVALSGTEWSGAGLEGHAVNGPIHLDIPSGYRSAASVESLGHSPFQCRGDGCNRARRTWDDDHKRIEIGDGPTLVKLSSENGPVSVATDGGSGDDND